MVGYARHVIKHIGEPHFLTDWQGVRGGVTGQDMTECAKPLRHTLRLGANSSKWGFLIGCAGRNSTTCC